MERQQFEQRWHQLSTEVMSGLSDWRLQHPKATLREMELELDTRLAHVRARLLEDLALARAASVKPRSSCRCRHVPSKS